MQGTKIIPYLDIGYSLLDVGYSNNTAIRDDYQHVCGACPTISMSANYCYGLNYEKGKS